MSELTEEELEQGMERTWRWMRKFGRRQEFLGNLAGCWGLNGTTPQCCSTRLEDGVVMVAMQPDCEEHGFLAKLRQLELAKLLRRPAERECTGREPSQGPSGPLKHGDEMVSAILSRGYEGRYEDLRTTVMEVVPGWDRSPKWLANLMFKLRHGQLAGVGA